MSAAPQTVVISWIPHHGRSEGLAQALGARAVWMPWARSRASLPRTVIGWVRSALRTVRVVLALPRGSLVVVMCPPVFAVLTAVLAGRVRHCRVAADLHSGAVNDPAWAWSHPLLRWCTRRCAAVVVTNAELLRGTDAGRAPVLVLHDPPVAMHPGGTLPDLGSAPLVVFPASGAADEPLDAVVDAARLLRGTASVVVTGRHPRLTEQDGLHLPGFVSDEAYALLLSRAAVVLALTTREATMQRAGYEALELGRPLVCSDTAVLREAFGDAAVLTAPDAEAIAAAVRTALADGARLSAASVTVRDRIHAELAAGVSRLQALPVS